jgi:CRP-like cAMP-binding protein
MRKVLFIFGQLTDPDVTQLARIGKRTRAAAGSVLIREGVPVEALHIVLEGELMVSQAGKEIARLGAGEIVGEMSFIDARPPSATVSAARDAVLYTVAKRELQREIDDNVAFAARFYKAIATFLSDRVRMATASAAGLDSDDADELDDNVLDNVDRAGARFDDSAASCWTARACSYIRSRARRGSALPSGSAHRQGRACTRRSRRQRGGR